MAEQQQRDVQQLAAALEDRQKALQMAHQQHQVTVMLVSARTHKCNVACLTAH